MRLRQFIINKKERNTSVFLLTLIILFNIIIWLLSATISYLLHSELYSGFFDAVGRTSIFWMLGFLDPTLPRALRFISVITTMFSMITFTGGVIAYVSNAFTNIINSSKFGLGEIKLKDHIVIINWNLKGIEIIKNYTYQDEILYVVIFSEVAKDEVFSQIKDKLSKEQIKKVNLFVRVGSTFQEANLISLNVEKARSIIILSDEDDKTIQQQDILNLKIMTLLKNLVDNNVNIIAEFKLEVSNNILDRSFASSSNQKHILTDMWMGFLIAQTLVYPKLQDVYKELFSFIGAEFYPLHDIDKEDIFKVINAIPIYDKNNKLFVLSESDKFKIDHTYEKHTLDLKIKDNIRSYEKFDILIIGNNKKLNHILYSLNGYQKQTKTQINIYQYDTFVEFEENMASIEKVNNILILSKDQVQAEDIDSDVLLTFLSIGDKIKKYNAKIIVELSDARNYDVIKKYNITNAILTNEYISNIMSSLSLNIEVFDLFFDLLTYSEEGEGSYEIYIYSFSKFFDFEEEIAFRSKLEFIQSVIKSSNWIHIPIGVIRNQKVEIFKGDLNLQEFDIKRDDRFIVISK